MYKTYWGMEFNPFDKEQKGSDYYHGTDFDEAGRRLEHLKNVKGIGLFTGHSGYGKTCAIRNFVECLNKNLYQVIYIQLTTVGVNDFYRDLSLSLGLEPCYRKIDNFKQIQNRISTLYREQRVTPLFWIDEVQYLHHSILADLKLLMNFEMDSRNYAIMILSGLPSINSTLSMRIHEALYQRVVIHYSFQGIQQTEIVSYIKSRLELCGVSQTILEEAVYEVIGSYSNGSIRKLDHVMHTALMIGCSKKAQVLDRETIMEAINEAELI
ncbi:MAG: ExeA family protein [Lachnotalea sp.]